MLPNVTSKAVLQMIAQITVHVSKHYSHTLSFTQKKRITYITVAKPYPLKVHPVEDHKNHSTKILPSQIPLSIGPHSSQYQNLTLSHSAQERTTKFTVPKSYPLKFHSLQDHTSHSTKILPFHIPLRIGRHNSPYTALPSQTLRCIPGHNIW